MLILWGIVIYVIPQSGLIYQPIIICIYQGSNYCTLYYNQIGDTFLSVFSEIWSKVTCVEFYFFWSSISTKHLLSQQQYHGQYLPKNLFEYTVNDIILWFMHSFRFDPISPDRLLRLTGHFHVLYPARQIKRSLVWFWENCCSYRWYFNTFHHKNPTYFAILCVIHTSHDISCHR